MELGCGTGLLAQEATSNFHSERFERGRTLKRISQDALLSIVKFLCILLIRILFFTDNM